MFWLHDKMTKLRPPADETIARAQQKRPEPEKAENIIKELYSIYKKICPFFIQKFLHFSHGIDADEKHIEETCSTCCVKRFFFECAAQQFVFN